MDKLTIQICEENQDIDEAARKLVSLLASCKDQQMHGHAGLSVELKGGLISVLHETRDCRIRLNNQ